MSQASTHKPSATNHVVPFSNDLPEAHHILGNMVICFPVES